MSSESHFRETKVGIIPSDWRVEKLANLCTKIGSGATPRGGSNIYVQSGTALIRSQNVHDNGFIKQGLAFIDEHEAGKLSNVEVKSHDVLLNITGDSICRTSIVPDEILPARVNQHVSILRANEKLYYRFLFFYLSLAKTKRRLLSYDAGGTRHAITKGMLEEFCIPLPKYDEQVRIGDYLWALTEKISINRSTNAILEKTIETIFKHWFVDFEFPNEEGKPYRSTGGEMVDSELGRIPREWIVTRIGDELETVLGGTPDTENEDYWKGGNIPWINSSKVNEFRIVEPTKYITRAGLENSASKLLPRRTTVLAITGATLGQVSLLEIESCANQSVVGILGSESIPSEYIYFWTKNIIEDIISWQTGGAQQHINKNNIKDSLLLIPSRKTLIRYAEIIRPLFDKIALSCFENQRLSRIRDTLLSKLVSGEIRVNGDNHKV